MNAQIGLCVSMITRFCDQGIAAIIEALKPCFSPPRRMHE